METPRLVTHIGKYEILGELGRGGMGVVYRAEDKLIGREVAIKQLRVATPELRQRFLVEARSGVLNHQNIVTVYDFGEQDGSPYIVMEFVLGESLERLLKTDRPMSLVEKLEIVRQVCEGLAYAHQKGVIHRDIKPGNIMVQPNGHIKIVDFGIARLESASGHTVTGAVIGTFHYIAPERLKGEPSDGRADIWACGVMLYLMLTGKLPFAGEDITALHKVVNEPFEPLSNFLSNYPPALDYVLDRALAKSPDDRYSSAEEMAADLEGITETLKRSKVGEVLRRVKGLVEQSQLTSARPMLLDLQRLDPQNTEVKGLLRDVQEKLSRQAKSEQLRQVVQLAEDAARDRHFEEALELYKQATKIDPGDHKFTSRINYVRELKEKADKIEGLRREARQAWHEEDYLVAAGLIEKALALDPSSTDLQEEHSRILLQIPKERTGASGAETVMLTSGAAQELLRLDSKGKEGQPTLSSPRPVESATEGSFTELFRTIKVEDLRESAGSSEPSLRKEAQRPPVVLTFSSSSDPGLTGKSVPIVNVPFIIGRDRESHLSIGSDQSLSRQHCVIDWTGTAYTLRDLGSSNGIWLNGRRLGSGAAVLLFGSVIRFSNITALTFVSIDLLELPDLTGFVVGGRFKLEELIRSSKKSALYRGTDQRLPQSVAVKVLSPDLAIYPGYLEQFNREAETAARLRHRNIAKVIDFGITTLKVGGFREFQAQYVCSDYMKGGSIGSRITERKFLSAVEVEEWLFPIGDALQYAHRQGIVHSGLKATSVVFDEESTPYLTDFAVATYSDSAESSWLLGAPEFMAPEQWEGSAPTHYTDQYSLAVLAYYSLSGVRPYEGQLDPDVRQRNFERGPRAVHEEAWRNGNVTVPAGLSSVLAQALAARPEDRYPSIKELCAAFRAAMTQGNRSAETNVFLSYRRDASSGWVTHFARELKRQEMTVFVDVSRQDNAEVFPKWLERAIAGCDVFICFLSRKTLASKWVREEIRIAHQHEKIMIPIFQEGFRAPELRNDMDSSVGTLLTYQGVKLFDVQNIYVDATIEQLVTMIHHTRNTHK